MVRLHTLYLSDPFRAMSNLHPFQLVSVNEATQIPLVDYGFKKISSCVADISIRVRALVRSPASNSSNIRQACQLLGTLRKANSKLLMQAMSKTLLGNVVDVDASSTAVEEKMELLKYSLRAWSQV